MRTSSDPATILVVDDDAATSEVFAKQLRLEGYHVLQALSAEAGFDELHAHRPDAILLDLRMPRMDGVRFLQQLRTRDSHIPVAIVTGDYFVDETVANELRRLGAAIRFKPLGLEDLMALVKELLASAPRLVH